MTSSGTDNTTAIEHMNNYKGSSFPDIIVPMTGMILGLFSTYTIFEFLPESWADLDSSGSLLMVLQSCSALTLLFFSEFVQTAHQRSKSPKASFSPAAAQLSGTVPFTVIQNIRIHQNQMENLVLYLPAAFAATAAGVDCRIVVASMASWTAGRILYRIGYTNQENPFWRIAGTVMSLLQAIICLSSMGYWKLTSKANAVPLYKGNYIHPPIISCVLW